MNIVSNKQEHTNFGEFPWVVGIYKNPNIFLAGGSLIAPKIVLSSAKQLFRLKQLKVRAGDWDIATDNEILPYEEREVQYVLCNDFNIRTNGNDIALLVLKRKFNSAPHIGTVCLPVSGPFDLANCRAIGWNESIGGGRALMISMTMNFTQCAAGTDETLFCAKGHRRTLRYATGSALVCPKSYASANRYYQIGIWSHGDGPRTHIMFTNVTKLLTWIQDILSHI
ncbi:phenoloxidase-activating factor 2-like [Drosophila navojoa]|nr:phenoloxidase-activating factor 2-like [Drosophila navojoa]